MSKIIEAKRRHLSQVALAYSRQLLDLHFFSHTSPISGSFSERVGANLSIANHYSEYGSRYSMYGACNPYATDPPVIVDGNGSFYGRLTLNGYHAQRTGDTRLLAWLAAVCE